MLTEEFAGRVVTWFRKNGRILPWRVGRDPYRIWISEIMLQQTRIEAVIPYYHRFLEELPSLSELAVCDSDRLMKLWEGLGYYSRARNLKRAAEAAVEKFGGTLPRDAALLRSLPGIGEYTAGAISSIAFGLPEPAVDGNVLRVVARVTADPRDVLLASTKKDVTEALRLIYPTGQAAGDLTEGIMELGERVCLPNGTPLCESCPLKELCLSRKENLWEAIPYRAPKAQRRIVPMTVFLLEKDGGFALRRRGETGLLAGLWEFYSVERALTKRELPEYLAPLGADMASLTDLGKKKHVFTHVEWHMHAYRVRVSSLPQGFSLHGAEEIGDSLALPTAFKPFYEKIKKAD